MLLNKTTRYVEVTECNQSYYIKCMDIDSGNPKQTWGTTNELAVGVVIMLWLQYGHHEALMSQLLEGML